MPEVDRPKFLAYGVQTQQGLSCDHRFNPPSMNNQPRKMWLPFAVLAAALVVWAGLFALGAYLEWGADQPRQDLRKPLIVMGTMAAFLAIWGAALWGRSHRIRHEPPPHGEDRVNY